MKKLLLFTFCISLNILGAAPAESSESKPQKRVRFVLEDEKFSWLPVIWSSYPTAPISQNPVGLSAEEQAKRVKELEERVERVANEDYPKAEELVLEISLELLAATKKRNSAAENMRLNFLFYKDHQGFDPRKESDNFLKNEFYQLVETLSGLRLKLYEKRYAADWQESDADLSTHDGSFSSESDSPLKKFSNSHRWRVGTCESLVAKKKRFLKA
jgi:hypothetical protein